MNAPAPQGKIINVLTVGMDDRKQAVFRMAFKMHTMQHYRLVEDAAGTKPDIAIVDMDSVDAEALWNKHRAEHPGLPSLIVTAVPPPNAPAPVLTKPVRVETLFPLLRQTLAAPVQPAKPATTVAEKPKPAPAPPPLKPAPSDVPPTAAATPPGHRLPATISYFDPRQGLLGVLQKIRRHRTPTVISFNGQPAIIALPNQDSALLLTDLPSIKQACVDANLAIAASPLTKADRPQRSTPGNFTALLWQVSLWTGRGRLMEGIQPHTPVRLRRWPNLTRLGPTPDAMRIAAFWVRSPVNLRLSVRMLNVPPQQIFDFLTASHSIGILEIHEAGAELAAVPPSISLTEPKTGGGLLSRLLRRVVGM